MNRKQLQLIIILFVVIGGASLLLLKRNKQSWEAGDQRMGQKVIQNFPLNDVAHVVIKQPNAELNLVKKNDQWTVRERGDYPANFNDISDLLKKIWELKVTRPVKAAVAQLARLELVPPGQGTNTGTLVEFKDKDDKTLNALLLGKKSMKESSDTSGFGGGGWPDGRFVMLANNPQSVALVREPLSNVEAKPEQWLNKDFFKVEKIGSISLVSTNATNSWTISRESETNEWKLADAKPDEKLDSSKVSAVPSPLYSPSFNDVALPGAKPEDLGMDKPFVVTVDTFNNFTYTLKVGKKPGDENYHLAMTVNANLPKERTPGKDEKPEAKEKLDKEFKDNQKKLEDKLKQEKQFEKWTYQVSSWTVEPLLKDRSALMVEKKEEPKKDDTKTDEPKPESK
ncbi:MAG: DUF4340 domain-containing protein [Verrucomicrobia bacterium]|nr:DUF4340 domain-containing protein [Verrucomicrobiota bacterium]